MKTWIIALALLLVSSIECYAWDLAWTYTPGTVAHTGFRIYRKQASEAGYSLLATVADTARTFSDPVRLIGDCYRVTAFIPLGETAPGEGCALVPDGKVSGLTLK